MTPKYDRRGLEGALVERFLGRVAALAARERPASVLDAGCGEGFVTERLPGERVAGIDACPGALEAAARRAPHAELRAGDVHRLPYADREFDLVVCTEVLEHLEDPRAALRELRRVARRAVIVTVPHEPFFRLGNLARGRHVRRLGSTPGHRWTFTRRDFGRLVGPHARWLSLFPWQAAQFRQP